jgi:hypothetical protein
MYILNHFSSYYHFIHSVEWKKVKNQIVVWQTNLSNPLGIDLMKSYTFYSFIYLFDSVGEYNQPRAQFSLRKVKKQKSRGYEIPPPNMEPLPTPSGRRCTPPPWSRRACPPRGTDVRMGEGMYAPPRDVGVYAPPPGRRRTRPSTGRRRAPPPWGADMHAPPRGVGMRAPSRVQTYALPWGTNVRAPPYGKGVCTPPRRRRTLPPSMEQACTPPHYRSLPVCTYMPPLPCAPSAEPCAPPLYAIRAPPKMCVPLPAVRAHTSAVRAPSSAVRAL